MNTTVIRAGRIGAFLARLVDTGRPGFVVGVLTEVNPGDAAAALALGAAIGMAAHNMPTSDAEIAVVAGAIQAGPTLIVATDSGNVIPFVQSQAAANQADHQVVLLHLTNSHAQTTMTTMRDATMISREHVPLMLGRMSLSA